MLKLKTFLFPKNVSSLINNRIGACVLQRLYSNEAKPEEIQSESETTNKNISRAMLVYLERAKQHDEFMLVKQDEYDQGKRHLANIMGVRAEELDEEAIDKAIQYLFPSGLYVPKSRPIMREPSKLYPKQKEAQFDIDGKPFHSMFYTVKPNYYKAHYDIATCYKKCVDFEVAQVAKGILDATEKLELETSQWKSKENIEELFLETLKDSEYEFLTKDLDRLCEHPYFYLHKDFIFNFREDKPCGLKALDLATLQYDEQNRPFSTATGSRKNSHSTVTVKGNGTGKFTINGRDLLYFKEVKEREQLCQPLVLTNLLKKVDIVAYVQGGGIQSQAGSIRYALSHALCSFVDKPVIENLRLAGLLTVDIRYHERKKPGKWGARRSYTWLKR